MAKTVRRKAGEPLPKPPKAAKKPVRHTYHGVELVDEYAWLRADNWQEVLKDPGVLAKDIREYLEAENAYTEAVLKPTRSMQKRLAREMRARIKEDDSGVPAPDGDWAYFDRYREGGEHPLVCRKPREGGRAKILLNGEKLGEGKPFFDLGSTAHSPNHRLLAWSVDEKGSEYYEIRVRDMESGKDLPDLITQCEGDAVWMANSKGFYYTKLDDHHRPFAIFRHMLGTSQDEDVMVFEEPAPNLFLDVDETQSGRFAVISVSDAEASVSWLLDLRKKEARPVLVQAHVDHMHYDLDHHDKRLFILTNADGAEDFKIVETPIDKPGKKNWKDVIPHKLGRMITGMIVFRRWLVRTELEDGLPRIVVRELRSGKEHEITFDEEVHDLDFGTNLEFDTDVLRFFYSSPATPREVFDYNLKTRERVLRKKQVIPSGHDPSKYITRRIFATSHDGAQVPISLLYAKKTKLDGSAPLFLTGYGAYGHAYEADFNSSRFSLVDRGFVFAIAHIRGGTDKGWNWYQDGKFEKKVNSFHDFIAAGRHLAKEKYTSEGLIVANGASAGGLLMGAVTNMAPELFAGVIAGVPFVDTLNTMLDKTLPLTPPEWLEWGNPVRSKKIFSAIRSYSPYDNVGRKKYPAILALGGLSDPRVTYWEPAKWVARLRDRMSGGGPILLKTNMDAGHGGASGRFEQLDERALRFAFALWCVQRKGVA